VIKTWRSSFCLSSTRRTSWAANSKVSLSIVELSIIDFNLIGNN
jgi:hypothetical protein